MQAPAHRSDVAQDIPSEVPLPGLGRAVAAMLQNHVLGSGVRHHQPPVLDRFLCKLSLE